MSEVIGLFCSFLPREDCVGCCNLIQEIKIPVPVARISSRVLPCCELREFVASIEVELLNKKAYCSCWICQCKKVCIGSNRIGLCSVDGSIHGKCRLCGKALY